MEIKAEHVKCSLLYSSILPFHPTLPYTTSHLQLSKKQHLIKILALFWRLMGNHTAECRQHPSQVYWPYQWPLARKACCLPTLDRLQVFQNLCGLVVGFRADIKGTGLLNDLPSFGPSLQNLPKYGKGTAQKSSRWGCSWVPSKPIFLSQNLCEPGGGCISAFNNVI